MVSGLPKVAEIERQQICKRVVRIMSGSRGASWKCSDSSQNLAALLFPEFMLITCFPKEIFLLSDTFLKDSFGKKN